MSDVDLTEALRAAERRLQAAQLASDVPALTELLDDSLLFTGPDGGLYTKEDDLNAHRSGHQVLHKVEEEVLRDHVAHCVADAFTSGDVVDQQRKIEELVATVSRMTR